LQRRLKGVAALKGISMRKSCQAAIEKDLTKDEAKGLTAPHFDRETTEQQALRIPRPNGLALLLKGKGRTHNRKQYR